MKKKESIKGIGNEDKLFVQKSNPLFALWRSDLSLAEFKILDVYLGRINTHDDEHRSVIFTKGEIEKTLGVKKINQEDLELRLKHLMSNVVRLPDAESRNGFQMVTLFEEVGAWQDQKTGLWTVELECTKKSKKYFFNIENLGYYRYKLRCVMALKSRYSYILFNYLEKNRFRKEWVENLDQLKSILNCESEETYKQYKHFNDKILKRVHKELKENTECHFEYEPVKHGRNVVSIKFKLETLKDIKVDNPDIIPEQAESEAYLDVTKNMKERLKLACGNEFLPEELDSIEAVLMANMDFERHTEPEEIRLKWAAAKYKEFLVAAAIAEKCGKTIKHRYKYFLKMLKDDSYKFVPEQKDSTVVITKSAQAFHNFEERDTDYDALILESILNGEC